MNWLIFISWIMLLPVFVYAAETAQQPASHGLIAGLTILLGISTGIWLIGQFLPGFLVKKLHLIFENAKTSPWFRDPAHPKRTKWLLSTAELLEDELPDPGQGKELYENLGNRIAATLPILSGTGLKWAKVLQKCGDALDTELDDEIKALAAAQAAPGAPQGPTPNPSDPQAHPAAS